MSKSAIERILEVTGKTPVEIAKAINASPQSVNNWHKRGISKKGQQDIAKAFNLSLDWISTGQGAVYTTPYEISNARPSTKSITIWQDGDPLPDDMVSIDFYPEVYGSMGNGWLNEEPTTKSKLWFREETLRECNVNARSTKAFVAAGDSMAPEINDGQTIAIDTSATHIYDGEIYAFLKNGELKIKYLFRRGDGFRAVSRNPDKVRFPDEFYTTSDIESENIIILGQYWWKSEIKRVRR